MSDFVLTPLATADISTSGLTSRTTTRTPLIALNKPSSMLALFLPRLPCAVITALTLQPVRFVSWTLSRYPNYVIVYRPEKAPLQIIAVMQGKRNIRRILKQRQ